MSLPTPSTPLDQQDPKNDPNGWRRLLPASAHEVTINACSPLSTPEQESAAVRRGAPRSGASRRCDANGWSRTTTARGGGFTGRGARRCSAFAREGRPTGFEPVQRGSRPRMLPLHHGHHDADDRTRTGGLSVDSRALCTSELRPQSARLDSNQRSPAPEAGGVGQAPPQAARPLEHPGGTRTRAFPVEGRASSPARPRGRAREAVGGPGIEPGPARYQRAVPPRTPASDDSSGGRARTCASRSTVARLPCSTTPERTEGEGVEPPRP
jgi:hypothetical protein